MTSTAWYLDSCASHHVCGQREMFSTFEELKPMQPRARRGLICYYWPRDCCVNSAIFKSDSRVCSLYGVLENGLYRIQGPVKYRQSNVTSLSKSSLTKSGNCVTEPSSANKPEDYVVSVNMWHQRFGHMYTKGLNHLVNNVNVKGIDLKTKVSKSICDNCELSKSTRTGFKSESLLVASEPLELLHMDL
uniref:Uncharacterized protein n=1 Tax=Strigamia maritima TaxID=126957 RepID=T1INW7_STRMM